jgi:hypothetical protein
LSSGDPLLGPIGLLGFIVTVGLFTYELRGMQRCSRLEVQAYLLEKDLKLGREAPFIGPQPTPTGARPSPDRALWLLLAYVVVLVALLIWVRWWLEERAAKGKPAKPDYLSIRIDANQPGVYRWEITLDSRSVASGVAADRDQAANDAAAALGELPR